MRKYCNVADRKDIIEGRLFMEKTKEVKKQGNFAEKHPKLNLLLGLALIIAMVVIMVLLVRFVALSIKSGMDASVVYLKNFVNNTDKVIVVAMITGTVSIIGVLFSSVVAKIIDYRYNVKKYLYDKREIPYEQFISMVYAIMSDTKKPEEQRMTETEMMEKVAEFSKGLTLWGSNRVVKKWLKYRKASLEMAGPQSLLLLEDIMYEMRRDVGLKKRMKKGDMLAFFVNDIEKLVKK